MSEGKTPQALKTFLTSIREKIVISFTYRMIFLNPQVLLQEDLGFFFSPVVELAQYSSFLSSNTSPACQSLKSLLDSPH